MPQTLAASTFARPSFENAFAAPAFLRAMLAFEAALAEAEAAEGLIPAASAQEIEAACASVTFDVDALVAEAKRNATLVVPFVNALKAEVAKRSAAAARDTHFGSTTQAMLACGRSDKAPKTSSR